MGSACRSAQFLQESSHIRGREGVCRLSAEVLTSPERGRIQHVQDFLLYRARTMQIQPVLIRKADDFPTRFRTCATVCGFHSWSLASSVSDFSLI
jgi:hypothetical protein